MKNRILILTIAMIFSANVPALSQKFKGMVAGGFSMSQVDGDHVYGYHRFGGSAGVGAILPINNWDITLETVFSQKGAFRKAVFPEDSLNGQYDLKLNYVEIPLTAHYTDRNMISAGAGFSFGRLVYAKEIEHKGNKPPYSDSVEFNRNDFSILAEAQVRIWKRMWFNVRFSYSLVPIRERMFDPGGGINPWERKQYNHMWIFRLVYVFNEKNYTVIKKE